MILSRNHRAATIALTLSVVLMGALPAFAALVPDCALRAGTNPPGLDCVLLTFAGIAQLILGITGSFALLMFVYGGFLMLSSAGESSKVEQGKTVLRNAVIGILIIFTSGYIVQYGISTLEGRAGGASGSGESATSRCEQENPGYTCRVPAPEERGSCITGLCPGGAENVCCPTN